jgi:hypothetical protein
MREPGNSKRPGRRTSGSLACGRDEQRGGGNRCCTAGSVSGSGHRSAVTNELLPAAAERMKADREQDGEHAHGEQPDAGLDSVDHPDGLRLPARPGGRSRAGREWEPEVTRRKSHSPSRTKVLVPLGQLLPGTIGAGSGRLPAGVSAPMGRARPSDGRVGANKPDRRRAWSPVVVARGAPPSERKIVSRCVSPDLRSPP